MRFRHITLIFIACLITGIQTAHAGCLNLSPLVLYESENEDFSLRAAGPLFEVAPERTALRPVFHMDEQGMDIMYPLGINTKNRGFFFPLYSSRIAQDHVRRTLFPFFWGRYVNETYAGVFPVYGLMYHRYGYDESQFLLWPVYSSTRYNAIRTRYFLWPVFSYSKDRSFSIFPLYGFKKTLDSRHDFLLWPIFHHQRGPKNMDAFLPLFQRSYGDTFENISVLWPFFSLSRDSRAGHSSIDAPWPLIRFAHGGYEQIKIFPFYHKKVISGSYSMKTILWPVYRKELNYDKTGELRRDKTTLFILSKHSHETGPAGEVGTETTLWPVWHRSISSEGSTWYFPWILPFDHAGFKNNYLPILTLVRAQGGDKTAVIDVLWHTFFYRKNDVSSHFSFSFLCSYEAAPDKRQLGLLFDLINVQLP